MLRVIWMRIIKQKLFNKYKILLCFSHGCQPWEKQQILMVRIKVRRKKYHRLFRSEVWWRDLVTCVCVCHRGRLDSISPWHQSGTAIKSSAPVRGSNTPQSQQSSTRSREEEVGQTARREEICLPVQASAQTLTFRAVTLDSGCNYCLNMEVMDVFMERSSDTSNQDMIHDQYFYKKSCSSSLSLDLQIEMFLQTHPRSITKIWPLTKVTWAPHPIMFHVGSRAHSPQIRTPTQQQAVTCKHHGKHPWP